MTNKLVPMENKKFGFEVICRGVKVIQTPEQVMSLFLGKVRGYFEQSNMSANQMVISVPTYATNIERQAYLDAAEIAGIKCIRLLNESTAIALTYGFFKKSEFD